MTPAGLWWNRQTVTPTTTPTPPNEIVSPPINPAISCYTKCRRLGGCMTGPDDNCVYCGQKVPSDES